MPFDFSVYALAATIVAFCYIVFGISAFGAAMFTVPLLTYLFPLEFVLPLCVLLDVASALALGTRFSREADWGELKWMVPLSAVGAVAGVTLLVNLPRGATLGAFGCFLALYALYSFRAGDTLSRVSRGWAPVAGFTGGAAGTMFGVGAPPYAIYLSRRFDDKGALRATLSNMVLFSTGIRATVFTVTGLMLADRLVAFALLVPFALAGLWVGNRIHGRISRATLQRVISGLVFLMGTSLLVRALRA